MLSRVWMTALVGAAFLSAAARGQESFWLIVPGSDTRSRAELTRNTLKVSDNKGLTFTYVRKPELDTTDGKYIGFVEPELRRAVRWPVAGTGTMQLGDVSRSGQVAFRPSRMQITRIDAPRTPTPQRIGLHDVQIATLRDRAGQSYAVHVDQDGQLAFASGRDGRWKYDRTRLTSKLAPGTVLTLLEDRASDYPSVYFANSDGWLERVSNGKTISTYRNVPRFSPGAALTTSVRSASYVVAVDRDGRIPEVDLDLQRVSSYVEPRGGGIRAGSPLALLDGRELFVIDDAGILRRYDWSKDWRRNDPRDGSGRLFGRDFVPSGHLTAFRAVPPGGRAPTTHLVTVDSYGVTRLLYETETRGQWHSSEVRGLRPAPGARVSAAYWNDHIHLSAVNDRGDWTDWRARTVAGPWTQTKVAAGFVPAAPTVFQTGTPLGFAIDRRGQLIIGEFGRDDRWTCRVCSPGLDYVPRLVSRTIVPNEPLKPAGVRLANAHSKEIWVLIGDLRDPTRPVRVKLKAGQEKAVRLDRDAGAKLVEVYEVPLDLGRTRVEERVFDLPPKQLYDVSVYEMIVQSVAIDSTKRGGGKIEDVNVAPKSVGIFPVPAGAALRDGDRIDVYGESKRQNNTGAVRRIDVKKWSEVPGGSSQPRRF